MIQNICPGCTCSAGKNCSVYLMEEGRHWFTREGETDGYVICEFCNFETKGDVEL